MKATVMSGGFFDIDDHASPCKKKTLHVRGFFFKTSSFTFVMQDWTHSFASV